MLSREYSGWSWRHQVMLPSTVVHFVVESARGDLMMGEHAIGDLRLIPYTIECVEKSWVWLSDPEIQELTMTSPFSHAEQESFFRSLPTRQGYSIWGIWLADVGLIGAAGLKNQKDSVAEYWGYIGERDFWGNGLGRKLISAVEEKARLLQLSDLYLKVSATNTRAIRLYTKVGFVVDTAKCSDAVLYMFKKVN